MQYFASGYRPGDPRIRPAAEGRDGEQGPLPAEVDVLIVGSGPAGLLLAAQLSEFPEILTRVVEKADGPLQVGRADGVNCRTVEMFEAFGLAEKMIDEAYWVNETHFWGADPQDNSRIIRLGRGQIRQPGQPRDLIVQVFKLHGEDDDQHPPEPENGHGEPKEAE